MTPLNIALIAHAPYPISQPYAGGLEMITHLLADQLIEDGHSVTLYAHADSQTKATLVPYISRDKFEALFYPNEHEYLGMTRDDLYLYTAYQAATHHVLTQRYDAVHNNSLHYVPMMLAANLGKRMLTSFHTPVFAHLRVALQILKQHAHFGRFTAVSQYQQAVFAEYVPSAVVYNGIDTQAWAFEQQPPAQENYLWVGRICPEKGTHLAIDYCQQAGKTLTLIGPKSNVDYFTSHIEPRLRAAKDHSVSYLGHLPQQDIQTHLRQATALLFTSTWAEPYGLVLAESLACATPVLGFDVGAASEIITGDVGCIVPAQDTAAFMAGFEHVSNIKRAACRLRAETFCGARRMVDEYVSLYRAGLEQ